MKSKPVTKPLFNSCLLASLATFPWVSIAQAQSPGLFSKLNVGNGTGSSTGDGTLVAEGKYGTSPTLAAAYQTAGSRMLWYPRKSAFRAGYGDATTWSEATMGPYSVGMGSYNKASGYAATAMGYSNTASGFGATAMGSYNTASGNPSTAIGDSNFASGHAATAMGYCNTASGFGATAMGFYNNLASGDGSTAMGVSSTASTFAETVIGSYNSSISGNPWGWEPNDPVFQIGNGHWELYESDYGVDLNGNGEIDYDTWTEYLPETYSNALTVYKNGNMELQGNFTLGGSITSANSPVLTQASALSSGFVNSSNFNTKLATSVPPTSAAWTNLYVSRGNITPAGSSIGGLLALGNSTSHGQYSVAMGEGAVAMGSGTVSLGNYSNAESTSYDSVALVGGRVSKGFSFATAYGEATGEISMAFGGGFASGDSAIALGGYDWGYGNWPGNESLGENSTSVGGVGNQAVGFSSLAAGFWTKAKSVQSTSLGSLNIGVGNNSTVWVETDSLFEIGNGNAPRGWEDPGPSYRSNAITTLKNGQTTLTNKAWKANPAVAPTPANSNGEALVVEGHARLKGKVIIEQPQGDISMGIYQ